MAQLYDSRQRPIRLGAEINRGGEGVVYEVAGDSLNVAKVYHKPAPPKKANKLRSMAVLACPDLLKFASWPLDVLHNGRPDEVAGVIMPRISGYQEIHTLYSPAQRKTDFADKDWHFLVHAARNCAIAVDAIHSRPIVIGDINPGNLMVSQKGTVFLIDCDSFQVATQRELFLCDVGVREFTPPELQGRSFHGVQRTPNHDLFGLALVIFHLLFMGRHPFAGRFQGTGDMPIEKAIQEYRYAFSQNATAWQMARPPHTLGIQHVAPELAEYFERAFVRGSERPGVRPIAKDWAAVLERVIKGLQPCRTDRGHKFSGSLPKCPWCELVQLGAPNFFLSITFKITSIKDLEASAAVVELMRVIESAPNPMGILITSVFPHNVQVVGAPPPEKDLEAESFAWKLRIVTIGSGIAMIPGFLVPVFGVICGIICGAFSLWWLFLFLTTGLTGARAQRNMQLRHAKGQLQRLERDWNSRTEMASNRFREAQYRTGQIWHDLSNVKIQYDAELRVLRSGVEARQRDAFLQSQLLCNAKIDGIGNGRKATLSSYGIETAFDVEYNRIVEIPGFGTSLASSLVGWRRYVESKFRFDPSRGVPAADLHKLLVKHVSIRQHLETCLRVQADQLRTVKVQLDSELRLLSGPVRQAYIAIEQAKADAAVVAR